MEKLDSLNSKTIIILITIGKYSQKDVFRADTVAQIHFDTFSYLDKTACQSIFRSSAR